MPFYPSIESLPDFATYLYQSSLTSILLLNPCSEFFVSKYMYLFLFHAPIPFFFWEYSLFLFHPLMMPGTWILHQRWEAVNLSFPFYAISVNLCFWLPVTCLHVRLQCSSSYPSNRLLPSLEVKQNKALTRHWGLPPPYLLGFNFHLPTIPPAPATTKFCWSSTKPASASGHL